MASSSSSSTDTTSLLVAVSVGMAIPLTYIMVQRCRRAYQNIQSSLLVSNFLQGCQTALSAVSYIQQVDRDSRDYCMISNVREQIRHVEEQIQRVVQNTNPSVLRPPPVVDHAPLA